VTLHRGLTDVKNLSYLFIAFAESHRLQTRLEWMMRFPPPVCFYAPLLVLVFGLATTGLEYELNLANDLARSLIWHARPHLPQHADAIRQLRVAAAGIALVCIFLWAALHFGFAARLARLSQALRDFGEGRAHRVEAVSGGDEVQELSAAFAAMVARLGER
jgi:hypothetical protein